MRTARWLFLLPLLAIACRDGGLTTPTLPDLGDPHGPGPDLACNAITDAKRCAAEPSCAVGSCAGCDGEIGTTCYAAGQPGPLCPAISCPSTCSAKTSQQACDVDPSCASLFNETTACQCASPGCCLQFDRCVDRPISCAPTPGPAGSCALVVVCGPGYAKVYQGSCPIGCVDAATCGGDCRTNGCPSGQTCQLCWTTYDCMEGGNNC